MTQSWRAFRYFQFKPKSSFSGTLTSEIALWLTKCSSLAIKSNWEIKSQNNENVRKMCIRLVTQAFRKNPNTANRSRTYEVLVTTVVPTLYHWATGDSWPGAKATKLCSCDKHPAFCYVWKVRMCFCAMIEMWWWKSVCLRISRSPVSDLLQQAG